VGNEVYIYDDKGSPPLLKRGCLLKIQWVSTFASQKPGCARPHQSLRCNVSTFASQKPGKAGPHLSLWCNVQAPTEFGIACNSVGYEYVAEIYFCGIRISLTQWFPKIKNPVSISYGEFDKKGVL